MCVGSFFSLLWQPPLPGSVYRSHEIFEKLWPEIESDNSSAIEVGAVVFLFSFVDRSISSAFLLNS